KNLYNFTLRYIGDREDAKDVCQKTFIKAYRNLKRLRDHDKFSTWLYQIAVNLCRDELKRRSRRSFFSIEVLHDKHNGVESHLKEDPSELRVLPDREVQNLDLRELLNRALQSIPEEQRIVIVMKQYQGLKFTEIADILEMSTNTAKSRMYYGLRAMRKVLNKWQINKEILGYEV
ncbi:RNA polymerase sigma factor, partial [bacterium]|nr:RNA polymerase sigma factor [bacterium]